MRAPTTPPLLATATATATRAVLRDVLDTQWIRETEVGDGTLGDVAARSLQFAVAGTGPVSHRRLVPQTAAAARLLSGPSGGAVEQALRGILATADPLTPRARIDGISLAHGTRDFAVNSALTYLEQPEIGPWSPTRSPASRERLEGALGDGAANATQAIAQSLGWINLGPVLSRQLLRLADPSRPPAVGDALVGTWLASVGAHEPQHTVSPPRLHDLIRPEYFQRPLPPELEERSRRDPFASVTALNWIEEGTADTLATWGGAMPRTATAMGVPALAALPEPVLPDDPDVLPALRAGWSRPGHRFTRDERDVVDAWLGRTYGDVGVRSDAERMQLVANVGGGMVSYPIEVDAMHRVLALASLDHTDPDDFAAATALLQGAAISRVPGRIADAIVAARDLDPARRDALRIGIRDIGLATQRGPAAVATAVAAVVAAAN